MIQATQESVKLMKSPLNRSIVDNKNRNMDSGLIQNTGVTSLAFVINADKRAIS